MADWRNRADAESWMLVNTAEAYRALKHDPEAREVHKHALRLQSRAEPRSIHSLWLAADAALAGEMADATALRARVDPAALRPCHQFLRGLVDALMAAREGRPHRDVRPLLEQAEAIHPKWREDRELRLMYGRCVRKLSELQSGLGAWWYYLRKRFAA
jgi:hypothetical protein